ncbi:Protein FAR1-RELATED SEQUENCE 5 [Glycine max]|nr:Protein FAR1-RELATED SEQUENCE 5 [Glycine max]
MFVMWKFLFVVKMDEDQWMYDSIMSEEVYMDDQNEQECGVNEQHVDCSDAFNTSQVFGTRDDVLQWARLVAHENRFVAIIMRFDTNTGSRGRTSFVLIGCEKSGLGRKILLEEILGVGNVGVPSSFVGNQWLEDKDEKTIIADMTKSIVKPRNILLTLKEHNANSCTTIKQMYNARSAYRSSIRGSDTEMQHLIKLLEWDQYIHWHRLKDENVVRDILWCHPNVVKLSNACNLVFLIDSTYKTNRYRLSLLDFVGVTPTRMTFSTSFVYLEGERVNNVVWALERFRGIFLRSDALPRVIVTDRDLTLMNAVNTVFPECTNLLCRFHIDKNVKGSLVDCPSEQKFDECLKKFEISCSPWPMFDDYVNETWTITHKEKFVTVWTNKMMHLGNTTTNRVEIAHWALKRVLQNTLRDLCSVWDAMNNMIMLQHTEIKTSFETSTHVVGHVFKVTLYKRLVGMVSRYALNQIAAKFEHVHYAGRNPSSCGCVMRTTHGLPCACELSKYVLSSIPLDSIHMFWRRLSFSDQGLSKLQVTIKKEMETISKRFEELDVCGKVTLKSKLREIAYPNQNSMCPPLQKVNTKGAQKKPKINKA